MALYLPMTAEAVAAYLGVILAGCTAVSIADSFAAPQVAVRIAHHRCLAGDRRHPHL